MKLVYKAIPNYTMCFKGSDVKGKKIIKDRLTVFVCCNMAGEVEKPIVRKISKTKMLQKFESWRFTCNLEK